MPRNVAVIVLNFKHLNDTLSCISKLKSVDSNKQANFIVVDHSPISHTLSKLLNLDNSIIYLPSQKNLGFAKGINRGLRYALKKRYKYFLIINPDVTIEKGFFSLLKNFSNKKVGLIAPAIRHLQNKKIMYGLNGNIDWRFAKPTHINKTSIGTKRLINSDFVSFACVLINKKTLIKTGFIDERYFMYFEDVDYCLMAKKLGIDIVLDTSVIVNHNTSSSFSKPTDKLIISFFSQIKFIGKWLPPIKQIVPLIYSIFLYPYLYLLWSYHYLKNNACKQS